MKRTSENEVEMIDKTTLQRLFCEHYGEMIHLARTLLYADEEAEDVVQDVFVRLMESDLRPTDDKMHAYLLTAVRNGCINRIRQKSLTEKVRDLYAADAATDARFTEERLLLLASVREFAERHLPEPHSTIFRLRFEQGLKLREIALQLDMNVKTVFKYLSQSIQRVQTHFRH